MELLEISQQLGLQHRDPMIDVNPCTSYWIIAEGGRKATRLTVVDRRAWCPAGLIAIH